MSAGIDFLVLSKGNFRMVVSDGELSPIKLAVETLQRDFKSVMGFCHLLFLLQLMEKRID